MEIGRYLVLSTAHIRHATAELLNHWAALPAPEQPLAVALTQYGWFVPTHPPGTTQIPGLPEDLSALLAFGRAQQCSYILLDSDGPDQDELPRYPW